MSGFRRFCLDEASEVEVNDFALTGESERARVSNAINNKPELRGIRYDCQSY